MDERAIVVHAAVFRGMTENQTYGQHSDVPREVWVNVKPMSTCFHDYYLSGIISARCLCVGGD